MDYIKGATDYLGITHTDETAPLATAAPNAAGAVSANELLAKKELNDEILNKSDSVLSSTKPDVSSKSGINSEIRSMDKSEVLHPVSTLPNTSGKQELNRELLNADKSELLHHKDSEYDSELRKGEREYQSIPLQTGSGLPSHQQRGIDLDSPSISSRPEFQRPPFVARDEVPLNTPQAAVLPPQMSSGASFQQNLSQQNLTQQMTSTATTRASPVKLETIQKDVVVHEHIHPVQKEEIQPVIYREREQLDVKQVTQMMHETQIQPTIVQQRELPAEHRQAIVEKSAPIPEQYIAPSREVDQTLRTQVVHAPIVQETIKKTIVEEVQPVLQKDVYVPVVVQNTKPIYEKIVEAPHVVREVREVRELGTRNSGYVQESGYVQQSGHVQNSAYVQPIQNSAYTSQQQYGGVSQQYASISQQPTVLQTDMTSTRRLSVGSSDSYSVQNMNMSSLPTGQVLPAVQSARPAYAYLPANYTEKRPDFIGTGAQYALAANGVNGPTDIQKGIYNPYSGHNSQMIGNIPQAYPRQ